MRAIWKGSLVDGMEKRYLNFQVDKYGSNYHMHILIHILIDLR